MTESIFAPFRIESEEGIRKVVEVWEGPITKLPDTDSVAHFLTKEEGLNFFAELDRKRAKKNEQQ